MIPPTSIPESIRTNALRSFKSRMEAQRATRMSWWSHWSQLAEMLLPRRYKWFITPNQYNRGSQVNQSIVDETGVLAARNLASGLMSGLTSPTRPWFRLGLHGLDNLEVGPVTLWLAEVERRMMRVFAESNFYQSLAVFYHDLAVFASAAQCIYEDPADVIRCYNPCLGEFFFSTSARLDVNCFYREFVYTIAQACEAFGKENLSPQTRQAYEEGGAQLEREIVICHAIEPNEQYYTDSGSPIGYLVPPIFKYREAYWEQSNSGDCSFLQVAGYYTKPFNAGRWNVTSNDPYGSGPGMDGLPAVRQLQIQARRLAEAIDKMVRPPMNASVSMKNEPASILPGALNYVANLAEAGFKPAFQIDPRISELAENIKDTQSRVGSIFFNDLFLMISQLDTVRSATEIDARREEKLIMLGPVIERFENEVLDPTIDRTFDIMMRRGLFPPAPPEIQGMAINVQYISMLAEAQRAAATTAIERLLAFIGSLGAAIGPEAYDTVNIDKTIDEYAELLAVPPQLLRSANEILALRQQREQAQQAMQAAQLAQMGADGAKTLSETDVGAGQNALQMMMQ